MKYFLPKFLAFDLLAIAAFTVLARVAHGNLAPSELIQTFWPFALGACFAWAIMMVRAADRTVPPVSITFGAAVWLGTVVTGLIIWGLRHGHFPHYSFVIVASVMSGLLLIGWRLVAKKVA